MTKTELWQEANAANREYLAGKITFSDLMGIVRDLAKLEQQQ